MIRVAAHRTAIRRGDLSRPIRLALGGGVIGPSDTVFDYGCGHGEDVAALRRLGHDASGWDPNLRPDSPQRPADVVNLGYVVNVIADPAERARVLRDAWSLAGKALLVSARLTHDARGIRAGRQYADGFLTGNDTFQRFYRQSELRAWIDDTLETRPVAVGPGVFIAFRDEADANAYLLTSGRRQPVSVKVSRADLVYDAHRDELDELMGFFAARGRLPHATEAVELRQRLTEAGMTVARAWSVVTRVTDQQRWDTIASVRRDDVLVDIALLRLDRRPKLSALPHPVQRDVKAFFGSYKAACQMADRLLYSAGDVTLIARLADDSQVGKRTPSALYVHETALPTLAPALRVYEGCARWLVGDLPETNVIKLATDKPKVSYLEYPAFDSDPHPELRRSTYVKLGTLDVDIRDYTESANPPILHRKETFVAGDHPARDKFARLTAQEERHGLLAGEAGPIGNRLDWEALLRSRGFRTRGHRIIRVPQ